jgi:hypothetical protein
MRQQGLNLPFGYYAPLSFSVPLGMHEKHEKGVPALIGITLPFSGGSIIYCNRPAISVLVPNSQSKMVMLSSNTFRPRHNLSTQTVQNLYNNTPKRPHFASAGRGAAQFTNRLKSTLCMVKSHTARMGPEVPFSCPTLSGMVVDTWQWQWSNGQMLSMQSLQRSRP